MRQESPIPGVQVKEVRLQGQTFGEASRGETPYKYVVRAEEAEDGDGTSSIQMEVSEKKPDSYTLISGIEPI